MRGLCGEVASPGDRMTRVSSPGLALLLGVSRTRVGQYVREGKLAGCYTGDGMTRRFEVALVAEALGRRLHPGQMLGNGADTRKALATLNPDGPKPIVVATARPIPAATVGDGGPDEATDAGRYEIARTQKAEEEVRKLLRANAEAEGKLVLASEVERQVAQELAEFEAVLRDGARKVFGRGYPGGNPRGIRGASRGVPWRRGGSRMRRGSGPKGCAFAVADGLCGRVRSDRGARSVSNPHFDLIGEIGIDDATGAAVGQFCAENPGPVDIFVNSPGGMATEGSAIFAALERHGQATAIIQGVAASAASLAMLGAKTVLLHDAAVIMIHEPGAIVFGSADDMRATAATLDKLTGIYARAYSRATGNPLARVLAWMKAETWMSAEQAVSLNFADGIEGRSTGNPTVVAAFDYRKFKAAPAHLVQMALQNGWVTASPKPLETETEE